MELWYDCLDVDDVMNLSGLSTKELAKRLSRFETKARNRTSLQALQKPTTRESGSLKIRSLPPLLVPLAEVPTEYDQETAHSATREAFARYVDTTDDHIQPLLSRFRIVDMAIKIVGVGSAGTRCWIVPLEGRDDQDPLFLQIREAVPSVLEDHLRPSKYPHQGSACWFRVRRTSSSVGQPGPRTGSSMFGNCGTGRVRQTLSRAPIRNCGSTPVCSQGRWREEMHAPETLWQSLPMWALRANSTIPSPSSQ